MNLGYNVAIKIVNEVEKQMRSEKKREFDDNFGPEQLGEWWCYLCIWRYLGGTGLLIICDWCNYYTSTWRSLAGVGYKLNMSYTHTHTHREFSSGDMYLERIYLKWRDKWNLFTYRVNIENRHQLIPGSPNT